MKPVPEPPTRCAYGHEQFTTGPDYIEGGVMIGYSACTACEDLRAHQDAYQEWLDSEPAEPSCRTCDDTGWAYVMKHPPDPQTAELVRCPKGCDEPEPEPEEEPEPCRLCWNTGTLVFKTVPHRMDIGCPFCAKEN